MTRWKVLGTNARGDDDSGWGTGPRAAGPWTEYVDAPDRDAAVAKAKRRQRGADPMICGVEECPWDEGVTLWDRLRRWLGR